MAATQAQLRTYHWHKQVALYLGYGQSTWRHRVLDGSLTVPTSTGNQLYVGQGPTNVDETTINTLVWAVWRNREPKTNPNDDLPMGRTRAIRFSGQLPVIDDNGADVLVSDEDWITTPLGKKRYKIENPQLSPEEGFWIFTMEELI